MRSGWNSSSASRPLPHAHEFDGAVRRLLHAQGGAAAPVAVDAGEHDPRHPRALRKGAGGVNRVLPGEGVGDEQRLHRVGGGANGGEFGHQPFVDVQAAGGVEQQDVEAAEAGGAQRALGDRHRRLPATTGSASTSACAASCASCSCAAGRWTSSDATSVFLRSRCARRRASFAVVVVLPEPWRPTSIATAGGPAASDSGAGSPPSASIRQSWTVLTTICPGGDASERPRADGAVTHSSDEGLRHRQRHVGLEQRHADLAQRSIDVAPRQRAAPGQPVEDVAESAGKRIEHRKLGEV